MRERQIPENPNTADLFDCLWGFFNMPYCSQAIEPGAYASPVSCYTHGLKRGVNYLRLKPDGHLGFIAVTFFTVFPLTHVIVIFFCVGVAVVDGVEDGVGSTLDLLASH